MRDVTEATKGRDSMNAVFGQTQCRSVRLVAAVFLAASSLGLGGCGGGSKPDQTKGQGEAPTKIKVCYLGLTCEPPIFVAYEKGFFKEEGLDVELEKSDWDSMRDGLGLGKFQATHHLLMYMMKPMEVGLDVKITGGIHTGCLRVQAGKKTNIKTIEDLKGKKVGVSVIGSPPHLFATRVMAAHGLHPETDVEWVTLPADTFSLALDQGKIDAVASAEPIGTLLISKDKVNTVCDQAATPPYGDEFCCVVTLNGKFARENPVAAAKVTRALLKGAKWVNANPVAAAKLAVEKKYVSATAEINAQAIAALKYRPGVAKCRQDLESVAVDLKNAGFLKPATDPVDLARKAWMALDGVTDEWIQNLSVEKVADGGPIQRLNPAEFVQLFDSENCCSREGCLGCCGDLGRGIPPLDGQWALLRPTRLERELLPNGGQTLVAARR
jgi:NitT/TauT family transport system substrate-binding protein